MDYDMKVLKKLNKPFNFINMLFDNSKVIVCHFPIIQNRFGLYINEKRSTYENIIHTIQASFFLNHNESLSIFISIGFTLISNLMSLNDDGLI